MLVGCNGGAEELVMAACMTVASYESNCVQRAFGKYVQDARCRLMTLSTGKDSLFLNRLLVV